MSHIKNRGETPLIYFRYFCGGMFRVTGSNVRYVPSKCIRERSKHFYLGTQKCGNDGLTYQPWLLHIDKVKIATPSFKTKANRTGKAWKRSMHFNGKEFSDVPFRMEKEEYL